MEEDYYYYYYYYYAGHVALTVNRRSTDRDFTVRLMEIDNLEDLGAFGRIILK